MILEEFRQAHQDETRPYGGSGLGLALAKKLWNYMVAGFGWSPKKVRVPSFILPFL